MRAQLLGIAVLHVPSAPSRGSGCGWSRCRWPAPRPSPSPCSTATTGCCGPMPAPTAAGACRSRSRDVDPRYLAMLLAYEDKRFRQPSRASTCWAIARAGWLLVRHRRIVSGGSTITMQVVRLLLGEHDRSLWGKIRQALLALALERRFSKDEILRLYLRLAPFGGNLEGVRAASLAYFGKEPRRLSVAEAALLVAIPQSPEARRPDRSPEAARRARNHVLARMLAAGVDLARRRRPRHGRAAGCRAGAARVPHAGAAPGRRRGGAAPEPHRAPPDARLRGPGQHRGAGARLRGDAGGPACRPRWSWSTTAPARSSPTSARRACSTWSAPAPSTWPSRCARRARR